MNIEELISQYLDGTLSSEAEAELHHRLSVSPEARKIFRAQIALQGVARDARVLHTPSPQMRNALFSRLQREEGMGSFADSGAPDVADSVPASPVAPLLMQPQKTISTPSRFASLNHSVSRSGLAVNQATERRRRRRLAAILLPLLVLVVASGIVWQRGGFGGNQAEPSLADAQLSQGVGVMPQTKTESGNGAAASPVQADSAIAGKVGQELLAMNQPTSQPAAASADEGGAALYRTRAGRAEAHNGDAITAMDDVAPESISHADPFGTVEDSEIAMAEASRTSEASGGAIARFDEDEASTSLKLDARDGTMMLDGSGRAAYLRTATADTTPTITIAELLAEGEEEGMGAEHPLDRGVVFSNSMPPSGGISLMGTTPATTPESSAPNAIASAEPPPPPVAIAADLHKINPRGRSVKASSKQLNKDAPAEFAAEKSEEGKSLSKARKKEVSPAQSAVVSSSQQGLAAAGPQVGADDIAGFSNNQLTFTKPATQRLLAETTLVRNAQLYLDSAHTIQVTLVQKGESKRTRGEATELQYEVVDGQAVIDLSPLPAQQRQQLQGHLRSLGKAE